MHRLARRVAQCSSSGSSPHHLLSPCLLRRLGSAGKDPGTIQLRSHTYRKVPDRWASKDLLDARGPGSCPGTTNGTHCTSARLLDDGRHGSLPLPPGTHIPTPRPLVADIPSAT